MMILQKLPAGKKFYFLLFIILSTYYPAFTQSLIINEDTVYYSSDSLFYSKEEQQMIELFGNGKVRYKDMSLDAGYIKILVDSQLVYSSYLAQDDDTLQYPFIIQQNDTIYGKTIFYNLKEETGKIEYGQSHVENGFYIGEKLTSIERKRIYFTNSQYTTCSLVPHKQHYYFKIKDMKVIPKDRVFARHIQMYINRVPYFYLPFSTHLPIQDSSGYFYMPKIPVFYFPVMVYPIRRDRHSGILFPKFGKENISGTEYWVIKETGYYWAINDYTDYLFRFNFYSTSNVRFENQFRYKIRYLLSGDIKASYWTTETKKEYRLNIKHDHIIDPTSRLVINGNFVSSNQFYRYESDNYQERLERKTSSNLKYSKNLDFGSISLNVNRDENFDTKTVTQRLPQFSFNMKQFEYKGIYLSYQNQALVYYDKRPAYQNTDSSATLLKKRYGAVHSMGIRKNIKWKTYLNINPAVNLKEIWFDYAKNQEGEKTKGARVSEYDFNVSLNNTLYGVFAPNLFGIKTVRHEVKPNITFSYKPADEDSSRTYESFSPVSYYPNRTGNQSVNFSLGNLFQAKLKGEEGKEKKIRLFNVDFSTNYNKNAGSKKWSDLRTTFSIRPNQLLDIRFNSAHDLYEKGDTISPFHALPSLKQYSISNMSKFDFHMPMTAVGPFFLPFIPFRFTSLNLGIGKIPFITIGKSEHKKSEKKDEEKSLKNINMEKTDEDKTQSQNRFYRVFDDDWEGANTPKFKISLGHNFTYNKTNINELFSSPRTNQTNQLSVNMDWAFSKRWNCAASFHYDIKEKELVRYEFRLNNDLHCWEFMFRYREERHYQGYYFLLNIVDLPDIKIEQNRRFE